MHGDIAVQYVRRPRLFLATTMHGYATIHVVRAFEAGASGCNINPTRTAFRALVIRLKWRESSSSPVKRFLFRPEQAVQTRPRGVFRQARRLVTETLARVTLTRPRNDTVFASVEVGLGVTC